MIERFEGKEGRRRLIQALRAQFIVRDDEALATELASKITLRELQYDEQLIAQDDSTTELYFLLSGKVAIIVNKREIAIRGAGTHVGEMALIDPSARRSASIVAIEKTLVAEISEPSFVAAANKYPKLWRYISLELASRLRERNKYVAVPNPRPIVFIGSSKESLDIAKLIQSGLMSEEILVHIWADDVFRPSHATIEDLEVQMQTCDFAVLVFGPDDTIISRGAISEGPRDDVLIELGMFMGAIGRERTFFVRPRDVTIKIPSDLYGLTPIEYTSGSEDDFHTSIIPVCDRIRQAVSRLGPK